jgi:carbon-monoxide dehydrogenase large subunit
MDSGFPQLNTPGASNTAPRKPFTSGSADTSSIDGQFLAGSLADYLLPTASDFPVIRALALEVKAAPHNPLGAKGAGEGGIIPVGGVIANAVADALSSLGVEPRDLPLSPPKLWELIAQARQAATSSN